MEILNFRGEFKGKIMKHIHILLGISICFSSIIATCLQYSSESYKSEFYKIMETVGIVILIYTYNMVIYFLKKRANRQIYIISILITLLMAEEIVTFINFLLNERKLISILITQNLISKTIIFSLFCISLMFSETIIDFLENKNLGIIQIVQFALGGLISKLSSIMVINKNRIFIILLFILFILICTYMILRGIKSYILNKNLLGYVIAMFVFLQLIASVHCVLIQQNSLMMFIFGWSLKSLSYILLNIVFIIFIICNKEYLKNNARKEEDKDELFIRFRDVVKYSRRNIIVINKESNVIYVNIEAKFFLNKYMKNIEGLNIYDIIKGYKHDIDFKSISDALSAEDVWRGEVSFFENKAKNFLKCEIVKICKDNESYEYAIFIEDITKNKLVYEKLQRSEKRFIDMANNMPDFMIKVDKNHTLEFISASYCDALGYSYKELRGENVFKFVHEDDKEKVYTHAINSLKTGVVSHIEYRMKVNGGKYIWVESVGNLKLNHNRKFESAVITSRDISKRKYYENALIDSERKYREFFNMVPNYIYVIPLDDDIIEEVNDAMKETFIGDKLNLEQPMTLASVFGVENAQLHYRYFYEILRGKTDVEFELSIKNIAGDNVTLQVSINPIFDEERLIKIICMAKDITHKRKIEELQIINESDRKKLQETMEYDRIKTEFFANISHELRTPINVILAAIQLDELEGKKKNNIDKGCKNRNVLKQNCFRLLRLINNLIDLTKIDSGYFELNLTNYDMVNMIESIVQSIVPYAKNKDITMIFDTNVEEKIMAIDLDKIERVILNLISNAIKFTPRDGEIYVNLVDMGDYIEIHVKDTGRGIPSEKLDFIFERFRQVDESLSRDHEGSGIGLYLVKSLIELHDGSISVNSNLGRGSDFIVKLPCKLIECDEVAATLESDAYKFPVERVGIELSDIYEI